MVSGLQARLGAVWTVVLLTLGLAVVQPFEGHSAFAADPPTITAVSPLAGPLAGGTTVTITGTNLEAATSVTFGGSPAASFVVVNSETITAVTPAVAEPTEAAVTVSVGDTDVTFGTLFSYLQIPTVASVSPGFSGVSGGGVITLSGTGFVAGTTLTVGGTSTPVTVVNDTTLTFVAPALAKGERSIVVTTPGGVSNSSVVLGYYNILVNNPGRIVGFETRAERFEMGALASRTKMRPYTAVQAAGGGLFRVFGIDSRTGQTYSYLTDQQYSLSLGGGNEGFEGGYVAGSVSSFTPSVTSSLSGGRQNVRLSAPYGFSCAKIGSSASQIPVDFRNGLDRFCSVFGPEIWSNAFAADAGEALSFQYSANSSDEYEPYGFLVKVRDLGGGRFSYGGFDASDPERAENIGELDTHDLILYARGRNTSSQGGYVTASGNISETGFYRFRFVNGSFDGTGGSILGADFTIDAQSISVARAHAITFANVGDQIGAGNATFTVSATSSAGLPLSYSTTTSSVCDFVSGASFAQELTGIASGSTVTVRKRTAGTCTLLANSAAGEVDGVNYVAAELASRTLQIRNTAAAPSAVLPPSISGSSSTGTTLLANVGEWSDGGAEITATSYQWKTVRSGVTSDVIGATAATFCVPNTAEFVGATIVVSITRTNSTGSTTSNSAPTAIVAEAGECAPTIVIPPPAPPAPPPAPVVPTVTPLTPRPPQAVVLPIQPSIQAGPVLRNNVVSPPPVAPTGSINGVPTTVSSLVTNPTQLSLRQGGVNIAVNVNPQQGLVRQGTGGETEVQVRNGGTAAMSGSGLAPRSTVQVFLPLQGSNAKELARIPVDAAGSFSGDAVFATSLQDAPIPVGRQTLQMVTLDDQGRQNVVEFTVNIAQPPPAPELNRVAGVTPQLLPGQSLATNAGVPEVVQVTALQEQKQTIIQGDGWTMAVDVNNPNASVRETADGGVLLELVRNETASISGSGFMPLTRADVWLFSEPTLLGTVDIDANGAFNGVVSIDGNVVAVGEHTLQLQGIGKDGYVRAANLGVVVGDEQELATAEQAQSLLWLLWVLLAVLVVTGALYGYSRTERGQETLGRFVKRARAE